MSEMNPNHPTTQAVHEQWHKIAALIMLKHGDDHVRITMDDLRRIPPDISVTVQELPDGLHIRLVDGATAERLAREHGGRPS